MSSTAKIDKTPFHLPGFSTNLLRSTRQWIHYWKLKLFYPKAKEEVSTRIQGRVAAGGRMTSTCRCGACKLVSKDGPRQITVCHCSVCRNDEAVAIGAENAPAPSFVAVKRSACWMEVNEEMVGEGEDVLVFRNSSDFAKRGRCKLCNSAIVMDYEWFEPETIWLTNPQWIYAGEDGKEVLEQIEKEFSINGGLADYDVCWNSRNVPCSSTTEGDLGGFLGKAHATAIDECTDGNEIKPRGLKGSEEMDWTDYQLDPGCL